MNTTTKTTLALVATLALVGIGSMPAGAVDPDCQAELEIEEGRPLIGQSLDPSEDVTWDIQVTDPTNVTVELDTNSAKLGFGVFTESDPDCVEAGANMSPDCGASEELDTEPILATPPERKTCQLNQAGTYYFHVENIGSVTSMHRVWEEV